VKFEQKWDELTGKTISAVMIVKDEDEMIGKCLQAIEPQVDEIIVVDTGSKDKTRTIAKTFKKVKLYRRKWIDDFSDARNFANSKATKDWIFSVDADEVVTGLAEARKTLIHPFMAVRVQTRNYTDNVRVTGWHPNLGEYPEETASGWFASEKIRLWKRHPKVCFEYPVHEVVEDSIYFLGWKIISDYSIQVHHYGRLKDGYEYGHGSRYYDLLHKQFKSGKNDIRSLEQLATQAQGLGKFEDAINFWMELLKIDQDNSTAFLNLGHSYASMGNKNEARKWSKKAWMMNPTSKEAAMNVALCEHMIGGDIELAEKICEDLIQKHPQYPLPQALLNTTHKLRENRQKEDTNGEQKNGGN
jgi:glycosyltransferase involved in cell wall biosynthesis